MKQSAGVQGAYIWDLQACASLFYNTMGHAISTNDCGTIWRQDLDMESDFHSDAKKAAKKSAILGCTSTIRAGVSVVSFSASYSLTNVCCRGLHIWENDNVRNLWAPSLIM